MVIAGLDVASLSTLSIFILLFMGAFGPTLPEEIVLIISGYLLSRGLLNWTTILPVSFAGIVLSDNIIYVLGYFFGKRLLHWRLIQKIFSVRRQRWVRRLFFRYKYSIFFLGRYFYGLRPAILLFAGLTRVKWRHFFLLDMASAAVNTILWTVLGFLLAPFLHRLILYVKTLDTTFLYAIIVIAAYYILEITLLQLKILKEDSFPVNIAAPYKVLSLIITMVIIKGLTHLLHH